MKYHLFTYLWKTGTLIAIATDDIHCQGYLEIILSNNPCNNYEKGDMMMLNEGITFRIIKSSNDLEDLKNNWAMYIL